MKKLLVSLLLLSVIALAGCGSNAITSTNPAKLPMAAEKLFEKKIECASYKDKIISEIKTRNLEYSDESQKNYEELKTIFYSPKRNTCLYYTEWYFTYQMNWKTITRSLQTVYDYLSNETIIQTPTVCEDSSWHWISYQQWVCLEDWFWPKLTELKWE